MNFIYVVSAIIAFILFVLLMGRARQQGFKDGKEQARKDMWKEANNTDVKLPHRLTEQEMTIMALSADIWNRFLDIEKDNSDRDEVFRIIHDLQVRILSRPTRRAHKDILR